MQVLVLFFSFLLLLLALKFHHSRRRRKNLPPSPPALPIIGHLHLLKKPLHRHLYLLSQKYGPVIFLTFGSHPVLVVSSLSAAQECLTKNDIVFANRPRFLSGKYVDYNHTTMTNASYGEHWRNLRRIGTIELFSNHRLNQLLEIRKDEIRRLIVNLSNNSLHNFSKVELKSKFYELSFSIIMRVLAGKRYNGEDVKQDAKQFSKLMTETIANSGPSNREDFMPILNWIDGQGYKKRTKELAKRTDKYYQGLIDEHRSKKIENCTIDRLLTLQQSEPECYTDDIIKGFIHIILFAGIHTTAIALEWAMKNLLIHQSVLRKAAHEIDSQVGKECLLDETHLSKLPYLQNIVSETLRLYPPPLLIPHMSSDDCTVAGYNVPRGTMLLVNLWAIHRDPTLWEDPTNFKPERFDDGEAAYNLMPFGLGRRACPGAGLAQRVVGLALGSLIQCYEWAREKDIGMEDTRGKPVHMAEPFEALCKARPLVHKILSQQSV